MPFLVLNVPSFQLLEHSSDICLISLKPTSNTSRKLTLDSRPDSASRGSWIWVLSLSLPPSNTAWLLTLPHSSQKGHHSNIFIECLQHAKYCSREIQCHLIVIIKTLQGRCHCHTILQIRKHRPSAQVYPGRAGVGLLTHVLQCFSNFQATVLLIKGFIWLTSASASQ